MGNVKWDLQLSDYPLHFITPPLILAVEIIRPKNQGMLLASALLPSVNSVSEKFKCIGSWYYIRTVFKTECNLRSSLVGTKPQGDPKQTTCGRNCVGRTGRPLLVQLRAYTQNDLPGKCKSANPAWKSLLFGSHSSPRRLTNVTCTHMLSNTFR